MPIKTTKKSDAKISKASEKKVSSKSESTKDTTKKVVVKRRKTDLSVRKGCFFILKRFFVWECKKPVIWVVNIVRSQILQGEVQEWKVRML